MNIVIYKLATGEIRCSLTCVEEMLALQYDPLIEGYIEHTQVDDTKWYVVNNNLTPRPEFSETVVGTTISNLPIPTTVLCLNQEYNVDDGEVELTFTLPGEYDVLLTSFPFQDKIVKVIQS